MARSKTVAATYEPITVRFPPEILAEIRRQAETEDRRLNDQIIHLVKKVVVPKTPAAHPALAGVTP